MTVETATYIGDLDVSKPGPSDPKSEGDDHLRLIKSILKVTFPAFTGAMPIAHDQVASKAYVNSVAFSAALPAQPGGTLSYDLTSTNGVATWALRYPSMTGFAGQFLTNDGANTASWGSTLKANVLRFADGTDATKLAAFDLSGLTTATTRTYALPDYGGTIALRSDTAMQLLAQATVSTAVANIDFLNTFTSAYDKYVIEVMAAAPSVADQLIMRCANAGAVDSAANYFVGAGDFALSGAAGTFSLTASNANAGGPVTVTVELSNANSAAKDKAITSRGAYTSNTPDRRTVQRAGAYSGGAVSGFRLLWNAGANFTAGTVRVYGIKNS